ncbi:MAG: heavy metal translocating P-type ATPase [Pseudomonadota bacterium]
MTAEANRPPSSREQHVALSDGLIQEGTCFHCAEPIPPGLDLWVSYRGEDRRVCCTGCQAVAELIISGGQGDYYEYRESPAARPQLQATETDWQAFDGQETVDKDGLAEATFWIDGIHCGACGWLIETQLKAIRGVHSVGVDQQTGITHLRWSNEFVQQSTLLEAIAALGYQPHPLSGSELDESLARERAAFLKQLAVAGLGMMQVSMFAIGTYFGPENGMDPAVERLLYLVSMVVAAPVVFYSGVSFFAGALRALRARQLNMDVPVSIALLLAFGASTINFFRGTGPMYFESATMFVFLLLAARFIAMGVRHKAVDAQRALLPMLPDAVIKIIEDGQALSEVSVPRASLQPGDLIRVRPGDAIAADGVIESGATTINEALMTGESHPRAGAVGEPVLAGSGNIDGSITVRITRAGRDCTLSQAADLLNRARLSRPQQVLTANRVSSVFVACLLLVAAGVFFFWLPAGFEQAFSATLAVLVVTCPCALSLAIPAALSAATTRLARDGLLVSRLDALEVLPRVTCALIDKTGTLSEGRPGINGVRLNKSHPKAVDRATLLDWMAALEKHSNHPLAAAFRGIRSSAQADAVSAVAGQGIQGTIEGRNLKLGSAAFTGDVTRADEPLILADETGVLGWVEVTDPWREDTARTLSRLADAGIRIVIASGDHDKRVQRAAAELGIRFAAGELKPDQKLMLLRQLQAEGETVLALGDGVNDSGLLGGADVSVAMAEGADLATAGADVVLTGRRLGPLLMLLRAARYCRLIVRQNLTWAVAYNVIAVPFAAAGLIGPGLAALGMSASSLVVVLNAARLAKIDLAVDESQRSRAADRDSVPQPQPA